MWGRGVGACGGRDNFGMGGWGGGKALGVQKQKDGDGGAQKTRGVSTSATTRGSKS